MKVRGTANSVVGIAHETSWVISQEHSGAPSHTPGDRATVLGRLTQVLGRADICTLLAQPATWVKRPNTGAAPPEHSCRVSRAVMWDDPGTLLPLPVPFQAHAN